jgi:hypothetical protein
MACWRILRDSLMESLVSQGFPTTMVDEIDGNHPYLKVRVVPERESDFSAKQPPFKSLGLLVEVAPTQDESGCKIYTIRPEVEPDQ